MSNKLSKLAASALSIPGMVGLAEAAGPAESEASYRYTTYSEDNSPNARDDSGNEQERYKINVHQFHLLTPIAGKYALKVEGSYEHMSGASPVYSYVPSGNEEVYTHFNGASREARFDLSVAGRRYGSTTESGVGFYGSVERDYLALSGSLDGSFQVNDQMTTISGGVSAGYDWLNPNTGLPDGKGGMKFVNDLNETELADLADDYPARALAAKQNKWQISFFEGVGQIIDMNTVVQASVSATYKAGYLSDPYRDCIIGDDPVAQGVPCDVRPSNRGMATLSLGARKFLPNLNSAVHVDYRLYGDTWDVLSHTFDVDYYQNFAPSAAFFTKNDIDFQVVPGIRYYQQSKAFFYEIPNVNESSGAVYTTGTTTFYSSDPRLSHYGALSVKLKVKADIKQFSLVGLVERYAANPKYGFNADDETPGLPGFWRLTTGLNFRF